MINESSVYYNFFLKLNFFKLNDVKQVKEKMDAMSVDRLYYDDLNHESIHWRTLFAVDNMLSKVNIVSYFDFLKSLAKDQSAEDELHISKKTSAELEELVGYYQQTIELGEALMDVLDACKKLSDNILQPLDNIAQGQPKEPGKPQKVFHAKTILVRYYGKDEWKQEDFFSKILFHTGTLYESLGKLSAAGESYYKATQRDKSLLQNITRSQADCTALYLQENSNPLDSRYFYKLALDLHRRGNSSVSLSFYKPKEKSAEILHKFYCNLLECNNISQFNACKAQFLLSPLYKNAVSKKSAAIAKLVGYRIDRVSKENFDMTCSRYEELIKSIEKLNDSVIFMEEPKPNNNNSNIIGGGENIIEIGENIIDDGENIIEDGENIIEDDEELDELEARLLRLKLPSSMC